MATRNPFATDEITSNLEYVLRYENGINIIVRKNLLKAYLGVNGTVEVPRILEENSHLINPDVLAKLRVLAQDEDAIV